MSEQNNNVEHDLSEEFDITVTLTLDDDTELECGVVAQFPANGRDYIALLPLSGGEEEVYLYRFKLVGEEMELENIEDDEEYDIAADAYDALLDDMDYQDMIDEEE